MVSSVIIYKFHIYIDINTYIIYIFHTTNEQPRSGAIRTGGRIVPKQQRRSVGGLQGRPSRGRHGAVGARTARTAGAQLELFEALLEVLARLARDAIDDGEGFGPVHATVKKIQK